MTDRTCGSCRHFFANVGNMQTGQCRESAPVPIAVGVTKTGSPVVNGFHPPVSRGHVCGKWGVRLEMPVGASAHVPADLRQVNGASEG